jgi:reactive intermediate/imine deaminase
MSATRTIINTANAPAALGPYSQAVQVGQWLFTSGQIGLNPTTGELAGPSTEQQAKQAFANLQAVIEAAGAKLGDAVKLTLFLTDLSEFGVVNDIMQQFFTAPYPARSTVGVASLPKGARFEVEAVVVSGYTVS